MSASRLIAMAAIAVSAAGRGPAVASQNTRPEVSGGAPAADVQLTVDAPAAFRRGDVATLVLRITKAGRPLDGVVACLSTPPVFVSVEDALDSTPAGGVDLGPGGDDARAQPGCTMAIAGVAVGPGAYAFTWEPDTAGRVNLTFAAAGRTLVVPIDVGSAPPNAMVLVVFCVAVAATLVFAAWMRRRARLSRARP